MKLTPFPFVVLGKNQIGLSLLERQFVEYFNQIGNAVSIYFADGVSKSAELFDQRLHRHHVFSASADLQRVAVNDGDQVIQAIMGGACRSLPKWSLRLVRRRP